MIRIVVLLAVIAGGCSFLAFKQGGTLPGIVFALLGLLPIVAAIVIRRRNGKPLQWTSTMKSVAAVTGVVLLAGTAYSVYWLIAAPKGEKNLTSTNQLGWVCHKSKYFPAAAKFGGPGPHPVFAFYDKGTGSTRSRVEFESYADPVWNSTDPKQVQLVACLSDFEPSYQVSTCAFDEGHAPLFTGTYKGTLYSTRDRTKVADLTVPAVPTNVDDACPTGYVMGKVSRMKFGTPPDAVALRKALSQYVG